MARQIPIETLVKAWQAYESGELEPMNIEFKYGVKPKTLSSIKLGDYNQWVRKLNLEQLDYIKAELKRRTSSVEELAEAFYLPLFAVKKIDKEPRPTIDMSLPKQPRPE